MITIIGILVVFCSYLAIYVAMESSSDYADVLGAFSILGFIGGLIVFCIGISPLLHLLK